MGCCATWGTSKAVTRRAKTWWTEVESNIASFGRNSHAAVACYVGFSPSGPNFATLFGFLGETGRPNKELMSAFHTEPIAANVADADPTAAFSARAVARRIGVAPPLDREQAFAKARRRSARVRRLRRAILIGGLGYGRRDVLDRRFQPFRDQTGFAGPFHAFRGGNQDRHGAAEACRISQRRTGLSLDRRASPPGHQAADRHGAASKSRAKSARRAGNRRT